MSSKNHPNPSPAPVQKVRLRYSKRGRLRFTSHRDLARAFERGLRRVGVPMAYSQGFSPHPKISWAGAAPTGTASEAEYVELQLVERVEPETLRVQLGATLPEGMDLEEAVEAGPVPLAERLQASRWMIELPDTRPAELREAVERLMAEESVEVQRMMKDGLRTLDARAALVTAEVPDHPPIPPGGTSAGDRDGANGPRMDDWPKDSQPYGILVTVVRQTTPVVRPDDVLSALRVVADSDLPGVARATRLEQGRLDDGGGLADPLAQDRATAGTRRGDPAAG